MTEKDFVDLVRKMREAQAFYFKTRNYLDLRYALDCERKVDEELRRRNKAAEADKGETHG